MIKCFLKSSFMSNSLCWHDIASIATSIILTRYRVDMVYLYCYHFFNVDLYRRHHTDIANVKDILNMYIVFTTITSWTYRYFKVSRLRRCLHAIEFSSSFVLLLPPLYLNRWSRYRNVDIYHILFCIIYNQGN